MEAVNNRIRTASQDSSSKILEILQSPSKRGTSADRGSPYSTYKREMNRKGSDGLNRFLEERGLVPSWEMEKQLKLEQLKLESLVIKSGKIDSKKVSSDKNGVAGGKVYFNSQQQKVKKSSQKIDDTLLNIEEKQ